MVIFDALFAFFIYKFFGEGALYILAITCCVSFLRNWGNIGFIAKVYSDAVANQIIKNREVDDNENL